jgi:excisionase family DNA binding protein
MVEALGIRAGQELAVGMGSSITAMKSKPASSAVRATSLSAEPRVEGPSGLVKSGIWSPTFTSLPPRCFGVPGEPGSHSREPSRSTASRNVLCRLSAGGATLAAAGWPCIYFQTEVRAMPASRDDCSIPPLVATPEEASSILRTSRSAVYELLAQGHIDSFKVGRSRPERA